MPLRQDEVNAVPHALGYPTTDVSFQNPDGLTPDYDIAGIEFLSAASEKYPHQRMLSKVVKDQIDSSQNPGDNSLQGWWTRSQTDWSLGAGQEFMEPINQAGVDRSYFKSAGVDVFTRPGFVSLLPLPVAKAPITGTPVITKALGYVFVGSGTTVTRYNLTTHAVEGTLTTKHEVKSLTVCGDWLLINEVGVVEGTMISGTMAAKDLFTGFTTEARSWWVKGRALVAVGDKLYEHPGVPASVTDLTSAKPIVDMKNASWQFTGAASGPASILVSGYGYSGSSIQALKLDTTATLPVYSAATTVAEFPSNEQVTDIATYLGTYVGIASSAGVRIGQLDNNGGLSYGPLIGSPVPSTTVDVFSAFDRFLSYPVADAGDGRGGIALLDLSTLDKEGRVAWANWLRIPDAKPVTGAVLTGSRTGLLVSDGHLWETEAGLDQGWIESSFVRFGTLEGKSFQKIKVTCDPDFAGSLDVGYVNPDGAATSIGTMVKATGIDTTMNIGARGTLTAIAPKFTLHPDGAKGPILASWSLKAWPSVDDRGQTVLLPLMNWDFETDQYGVQHGYEGRAWDRWQALVKRATNGTSLLIKEYQSTGAYVALVDDATFTQTAPPIRASGFGGVIQVTLRTV